MVELLFAGYRVSAGEDEKVLEMDRGDGCTTVCMQLMRINCAAKSKVVNFTYTCFTTIFKNSKAFIWSRPNVNNTLIFPCVPVGHCRERKICCGDCVMNRGTMLSKEQDPARFLLGILVSHEQ